MRSSLARVAAGTAGLFVTLGVAAALSTPASAETATTDPGVEQPIATEGCVYAGAQYSEGAIIKVGDLYIECVFGHWSRI